MTAEYRKEIIERLERIAGHAVHTVGEEPFVMSLDDGIAIHKAIEALERSSGWISVKDRLPEEYGEYYITWIADDFKRPFIWIAECEITSEFDNEKDQFKVEWLLPDHIKAYKNPQVIAWQELPDPYEEEEG